MICRKVLIVLEVSVLKTADEVVGKIGDPKPINAESKPEQQQHQNLQQNVSGPVQRNMSGRKSIFTVCLNLLIVIPFYWRTLRARDHVTHARYF